MNINLTLIVQIFNFLIAYFIISKFLLKPAIALIKIEKAKLLDLNSAIETERERLNVKERIKESQWKLCQSYFKANTPEITISIVTKKESPSIDQIKKLSETEVKNITKELSPIIKSKVIYD